MHAEIKDFLTRMTRLYPNEFSSQKVLECGSYDINGNPRQFFTSAKEYIGIDWRPGNGVDAVSLVHDYQGRPDGYFDFIVSTSLLEHDPHWTDSIQRMCDLVKEGGSVLITCAGPGFHQHEVETSPAFMRGFNRTSSGSYYRNLTANDVLASLTRFNRFATIICEEDPTVKDVRIFATGKLPYMAGVEAGYDLHKGVAI